MKVILFGASGMVGQGVLRECLLDADIDGVLSVGRGRVEVEHPKLQQLERADLADVASYADAMRGYDACFFCLGVSSAGMDEDAYTRITYELTMKVANALASSNPQLTFIYVSGAGTDSSERGRSMWARVKGRAENALIALPFKAYAFRPGVIRPLHGARSKTRSYRLLYQLAAPLLLLLQRLFPGQVTTTEQVGRAMISIARKGFPRPVLESADINGV